MNYNEEDFEWDCEHETVITWECPNKCGYEYTAEPWINRGCKCPECGIPCIESSSTYKG